MSNPEEAFTRELEIFRTEAQVGAQFFYAYLAFNETIGKNKKALNLVNKTPLFWKTSLGAFETSFIIVLGRIFDQSSKHNIDVLLKLAETNIDIFSKPKLAARKRQGSQNADEWLNDYLKSSYEPTIRDFRELRKNVKKYRKFYEANYRDIRHKIYAHKEVTESARLQALFNRTNIRELQKIFAFVNRIYEALWELFHNGRMPTLRSRRYSVKSIMKNRKLEWQSQTIQERIVGEIQDFFQVFIHADQQGAQHGRSKQPAEKDIKRRK